MGLKALWRKLFERRRRRERRSYENPATPLNSDAEWLWDSWTGGASSASGVRVNETTALESGPVWRAVNLVSKDVARIPLFLYSGADGIRDRARAHPLYRMIRRKPSSAATAFQWKMQVVSDLLLWGNSYHWVIRSRSGRVLDTVRFHPSSVTPARTREGVLVYQVRVDGLKPLAASPREILHFRGLGDGDVGHSVIRFAAGSIGLGLATRRHGEKFFGNGARPSVAISVPEELTQDEAERIRRQFVEKYGGLENHLKPIVLDRGGSLESFSTSNEDAQLLGSREFDLIEVANWFGVPPHKLGHPARTSFNSLEQENQSYLDSALDPWLVIIEEELEEKLFTEAEKDADELRIEFLRKALVRLDSAAEQNLYEKSIFSGILSRDEVRRLQNLPPIPGGLGSIYLVPGNMVAAERLLEEPEPEPEPEPPAREEPEEPEDGEGEEGEPEPDPEEPEGEPEDGRSAAPRGGATLRALVGELAGRQLNRLSIQAFKRWGGGKLGDWLDKQAAEHNRAALERDAAPFLAHARELTGSSVTPADWSRALLGALEEALRPVADLGEAAGIDLVNSALDKLRESGANIGTHLLKELVAA